MASLEWYTCMLASFKILWILCEAEPIYGILTEDCYSVLSRTCCCVFVALKKLQGTRSLQGTCKVQGTYCKIHSPISFEQQSLQQEDHICQNMGRTDLARI